MEEEKLPQTPETETVEPAKEAYEWVQCVVTALLACILVFTFLFRVIDVIGPSMEDTFYTGHKVIITRLAGDYKQGDVVVLRKTTYGKDPIIKRVIAVGGQTVSINFMTGTVYVDGVALDEPYTKEPTWTMEDFTAPVYVPEGSIFVMGDNRNHSQDSRYGRIGTVDTRYVLGKVIFQIWPVNRIGTDFKTDAFDQ